MADEKKKKSPFTVDEATNSMLKPMPSITRLLNRKKLALSSTHFPQPPPIGKMPLPKTLRKPSESKNARPKPALPKPEPAPVKSVEKPAAEIEIHGSKTEIVFAPPEIPEVQSATEVSLAEVSFELPEAPAISATPSMPSEPSSHLDNSPEPSLIMDLPPSDSIQFAPPPAMVFKEESQAPLSSPPGLSLSDHSLTLTPEQIMPDPPAPTPRITKPRPARTRTTQTCQLHVWDNNLLRSNTDPLATGIFYLIEKGAISALFLTLVTPPPGAPVPHFLGSALAGNPSKQNIWTGLKWDPVIVPSVWNYFVKSGSVELSPPGTRTDQMSQRNVMRGAFGILPNEWLLLVRVGPENACRGALAIVSRTSMLHELEKAMAYLSQQAPKAA